MGLDCIAVGSIEKGAVVGKNDPHRVPGTNAKFQIIAALKLLGIYVAMYLMVTGAMHLLLSPEATAATLPGSWFAQLDFDCD